MKTLRTLALIAAALLAPAAARAQTIHGVVVEDSSRAPIAGVEIELFGADSARVAGTQTDSTGSFVLVPGRPGAFSLRLRHLSYVAAEPVELELDRAETAELELRMGRTAIPLEPVVVSVRRDRQLAGFYDRMRRSGFGRFISREEIEKRPGGTRVTDLLRVIPGVRVAPSGTGWGVRQTNLITMRGGMGRCLATVYIDGMPVEQYRDSGVDEFLSVDMLEGVEVYTGAAGAPSPIHARDSCGVVAFWTRRDAGKAWSWRRLLAGVGLLGLILLLAQ